MDATLIKNYLKRIPLMSYFHEPTLETIGKICIARAFQNNQVIFKEGDSGRSIYVVMSGKVQIMKTIGSASEIKLSTISEDMLFGEMALLANIKRSGSAIAQGDVQCIEIRASEFMQIISKEPVTAFRFVSELAKILCQRLDQLDQEFITHLTSCSHCKEDRIKDFVTINEKLYAHWDF